MPLLTLQNVLRLSMHKSKTIIWIILSIYFYSYSSIFGQSLNPEMVDVISIDGSWFIKHQISKGETLFSLSRLYKVPVSEIEQQNPEASKGISINEILIIPIAEEFQKLHKVKQGETLYSISREYHIKAQEVRKWNDLTDNTIGAGQELLIFQFIHKEDKGKSQEISVHTVTTGESLYGISRMYDVSVDDIREWNDLDGNNISIGQNLIVSPKVSVDSDKKARQVSGRDKRERTKIIYPETINSNDMVKSADVLDSINLAPVTLESPLNKFDKTEERGMAELIDGSTESVKYLALHRDAPKGAILLVRNELNDQVVFVRVIGTLPNTGVNSRVVVKISKAAWEKLGAVNKRFRVNVSYYQ